MRIAVVAVGGNSLIRPGQSGTVAQQRENLVSTCEGIIAVLEAGYDVVVTHGNGPQVGAALIRSEAASAEVPPQPLDVCVAETQGSIGYLLQQTLQSCLGQRGLGRPVVTLVTQVLVARRDPAFRRPTKPVGPFYSRQQAQVKKEKLGWTMTKEGDLGFRRLIPSPEPKAVVEISAVQKVLEAGAIVISCGGGGIPVQLKDISLVGLEAVVDKDHSSSLLASQLGAELLLMSTSVDAVSRDFGTPQQTNLSELTRRQAERLLQQGHFPAGTMGPKMEASIRFLDLGGGQVVITSPEMIPAALENRAGTRIFSD